MFPLYLFFSIITYFFKFLYTFIKFSIQSNRKCQYYNILFNEKFCLDKFLIKFESLFAKNIIKSDIAIGFVMPNCQSLDHMLNVLRNLLWKKQYLMPSKTQFFLK